MITPVSLITTPKQKTQSKKHISMQASPAFISVSELYHVENRLLNTIFRFQKVAKKAMYKLQDLSPKHKHFFDKRGNLIMIGKPNYKDEFGVKYKLAREFYHDDKITSRNLYDEDYNILKQYTYNPETHKLDLVEYFRKDKSIQVREKYDYSHGATTQQTTRFDEKGNIALNYISTIFSKHKMNIQFGV